MGKKIPMWQCLLVMVVLVALIFWGVRIDEDAGEAHVSLIFAGAFAAIVAMLNGWKWSYMEQGILAAINRTMQAILILAVVGLMLGSWMAGGVVPSMMYYGIKVIAPSVFLFTACLLCSIVSLATGSSWSTAGSMGVALIGVGTALGFPAYMTAGAVVSGAYFGDKMSPLSDTTNLAPAVAGATLFDHIKHMIWTTGPSLVIALVIYLVLGFTNSSSGAADLSTIDEILGFITDNYNVSLLCLIAPLFVIVAVALKLPALPSLIGGVVLGLPFFPMQGNSLKSVPYILNYGVGVDIPEDASDVIAELGSLLTSDGMQGMMWTISLILCAMVFGGIVDCTGIMGSIASALLKLARGTRGGLVLVTIISCILVNALCSDQYLAIILPGRMYKEAFEDLKLAPKNLSRCLEDSGTITSNFIPWNTCGATMSKFLQCPQWGKGGYAPFAILNWLNPLVSIFYGFTGISMVKMTDEEYARILEEREAEKQAALKAMEA
ncbi:MAG: Na+/H+ antiporter NhaC [Firmicutes bacterium]|nr:Na+/H+ antiporter NhaC [Bacillota bacterium]